MEAFTDRLMEVTTTSSEDGKTITHTVTMMDLYGENIASYTLETNDAYGVTSVTPTSDGGFIFAVGFNGSYIPGRDQIETGYHSRTLLVLRETQGPGGFKELREWRRIYPGYR